MKKKILITGAQGDIGQSICKIIRKEFKGKFRIDGIDILESGSSEYIFDRIIKSPKANSANYKTFIKKIIKNYFLVIPTTEAEINFFSKEKKKINNNVYFLINKSEVVKKFLNKISTHKFLYSNNFLSPKFTIPLNHLEKYKEPFFLKTIEGHGNKSYQIINSKYKFKKLKYLNKKKWLAQEFFDYKYEECTCCVIKLENFISTIILKRKLDQGKTYFVETLKDKKIEKILVSIAKKIDLQGSINIQLKRSSRRAAIFEINPRISGTVMMRHMLGFKDLIWWIEHLLYKKLPRKINIRNKKIFKSFQESFVMTLKSRRLK